MCHWRSVLWRLAVQLSVFRNAVEESQFVVTSLVTGHLVTGHLVLTRLSFNICNDLSTCTVTATAALPVGQLVSQQQCPLCQSVRQTDILTFRLVIYKAALCWSTETQHLQFTFCWPAHCLEQGTIHVGSRPTDICQPSTVASVMAVLCHQSQQERLITATCVRPSVAPQ